MQFLLPYLLKTAPPSIKRPPQVKALVISVSISSTALLNEKEELSSGSRIALLCLTTPLPPCSPVPELSLLRAL